MLHPHLTSYLENTKTTLNMVEENVLQGLKMPKLMVMCKSLAILNHSVTLPY